jgi:hypothetical protein
VSAIEDLEAKVERLNAKLRDARRKLHNARLAASPVKVGDVVLSKRWGECLVTHVNVGWRAKPSVIAVPRKKNGEFGKAQRHLYSDWELPTTDGRPCANCGHAEFEHHPTYWPEEKVVCRVGGIIEPDDVGRQCGCEDFAPTPTTASEGA